MVTSEAQKTLPPNKRGKGIIINVDSGGENEESGEMEE
jgi:hypothetical protein